MLSVTQGFFASWFLPRMLLAVSVMAVLKLLIKASISVSWFSRARSGANFPPILARKISAMLGSLGFSRLNLILMLPWFVILWRRSLKAITDMYLYYIKANLPHTEQYQRDRDTERESERDQRESGGRGEREKTPCVVGYIPPYCGCKQTVHCSTRSFCPLDHQTVSQMYLALQLEELQTPSLKTPLITSMNTATVKHTHKSCGMWVRQ